MTTLTTASADIVERQMPLLNHHLRQLVRKAQLELRIDDALITEYVAELWTSAAIEKAPQNGTLGRSLNQLYHQLLPHLDLVQDALEERDITYAELQLLLQGQEVAGENALSEERKRRHDERMATDEAYRKRVKDQRKRDNVASAEARKKRRAKQRVGRGAKVQKPPMLRQTPAELPSIIAPDGNVIPSQANDPD